MFEGEKFFSVGMVLRNHQGQFADGKTMRFAGRVSVLETELVGIFEALLWTTELSTQVITIESDSLLSISAISKHQSNMLELADIINNCREILQSRNEVSVVFVRKQANKVAHEMARLPFAVNSSMFRSSTP